MANNVQVGNYKTFKVTIDGEDYSDIVTETDIFQDIFSTSWSANLTIIDAVNSQVVKDLNVGSKVDIKLETDAPLPCGGVSSKTFKFVLQSISDKVLIQRNVYGYTLKLVAKEMLNDIKQRISKSYQNKTPQDLVSSLLADGSLGSLEDKSTDANTYDVIIPNWTPFTAINWVTKFAKTSASGADWVFYQSDVDGKFKFKSIEDMFNDASGFKFVHKNANFREDSNKENDEAFVNIEKYNFIVQLDGIKNLVMGFFGNRTIAHDIINKKTVTTDYKYSQDNQNDLTKKPYKGEDFDSEESSIIYTTLHAGLTESSQSFHETSDKWLGSRRSHVLKLETNRLAMQVAGSTCLWKMLGKTVQIDLPAHEDVTKDKLDKYYKGDYLVTAIRHNIQGKEYSMIVELSKKRLATKLKG